MDFYHYRMDVYTHFQHTFMFKQHVKWILHPMTPLRYFGWLLWHFQNPGSFGIRASKYISAALLLRTLLHVRGSFKVKCPVSGAKTWVQYVTLAHFCYVDIGTYCCVCITLLEVCIAVVHNSNIQWVSLKVNALSSWKYPLHQTHP